MSLKVSLTIAALFAGNHNWHFGPNFAARAPETSHLMLRIVALSAPTCDEERRSGCRGRRQWHQCQRR
jgi:hypothetical protein